MRNILIDYLSANELRHSAAKQFLFPQTVEGLEVLQLWLYHAGFTETVVETVELIFYHEKIPKPDPVREQRCYRQLVTTQRGAAGCEMRSKGREENMRANVTNREVIRNKIGSE